MSCCGFPTKYESVFALADLPWFELEDGRLVLADRSIGPIADLHAHVAMAFVRPMQLDLWRGTPETDHYLPMRLGVDLDVYINRNFSRERLRAVEYDLTLASTTAGGMRATHTFANLEREMAEMSIARAVLLTIDYPLVSDNAGTALRERRGREELVVFGSVHPFSRDLAGKLDRQLAAGARGIKMHPNVQMCPPDNFRARELYRLCGERGLPVFWHCGPVGIEPWLGRQFTQVRRYERPIAENPRTTFVLGHAGALQMEEALALCQRYENVYLELSSQPVSGVRRILEAAPPDRVVFGTDWPWYHQSIGLAKVLIASEDRPELRRKVLWENAARLLGW